MLYLLDANALIEAEASYYGFDQVPQFWDWLLSECAAGRIKMPLEIWNEVKGSNSALGTWINDQATKNVLILDEKPSKKLLNDVTNKAYAPDLTDAELEQVYPSGAGRLVRVSVDDRDCAYGQPYAQSPA